MLTKEITVVDGTNGVIYDHDIQDMFVVSGTANLTVNWAVVYTGTPTRNEIRIIRYNTKAVVLGGNHISFLGASMPDEYVDKDLTITCQYNGTLWDVLMTPDFDESEIIISDHLKALCVTTAKINAFAVTNGKIDKLAVDASTLAADAVETAKILAKNVTLAKIQDIAANSVLSNGTAGATVTSEMVFAASTIMARLAAGNLKACSVAEMQTLLFTAGLITPTMVTADMTKEVIVVSVSFEAGEQCNNRITIPYKCEVTNIYGVVRKVIAGTDDATVTLKNAAGTSMTGGQLTFKMGDALETAYSDAPTADNTIAAGDIIYVTGAKTTAGGKVLVSIELTRKA